MVYDSIKTVGAAEASENQILGVSYAPADGPLYARFEYDLKELKDADRKGNPWGLYAGYKVNGYDIRYTRTQKVLTGDLGGESSIKLTVAF